MPEIGEVARVVHYLRKHLVNRTIKTCQGFNDDIVYGKVGCSAAAFQKAVEGKKVMGAGQQGKYFYMTFDSPPHAVMHLGMTGWVKFSTEETGYYRKKTEEKEAWPPKYAKFILGCEMEGDREAVEVAFVDPRRLARIRLVDCEADKIRQETPLKENGPDPYIDKDIVTKEWLAKLLSRKKVPVKALLLDQANISGVGNWVADEVLYQAKIHPEQKSHDFDDEQTGRLHDKLIEVCTIACETLAESAKFPQEWLMKYRWDKGKKDSNTMPNGEKIVHLTVGGRTSAIVPSVQKKRKAGIVDADGKEEEDVPAKKPRGKKAKIEAEAESSEEEVMPSKKTRGKKAKVEVEENSEEEVMPTKKSRGKAAKSEPDTQSDAVVPAAKKTGRGRKPKAEPEEEDANGGAEAQLEDVEQDGPAVKPAKATKARSTSRVTAKPPVSGTRNMPSRAKAT